MVLGCGQPPGGRFAGTLAHLEQLRRAHPGTLREFLQEHNCRNQEKNVERIAAIQEAVSATQDQAVREAGVLITRSLVAILATLRVQVAMFDERIAERVATHPDGAAFGSLPGAGGRGVRHSAGALSERLRNAVLQRDRAGHGSQRK